MAPAPIDAVLETGSPSSRRNKGKIAEAIQNLSNLNSGMDTLELPTDPDAQATVTDFLDFTEYLPADMIRSLTLVGNLDQLHMNSSAALHELTKKNASLPEMPADSKLDPVRLREEISADVSRGVSARILAHAEAVRMSENIDRHVVRAKNIYAKLLKMAEEYPTSREASPKLEGPGLVRSQPKIILRTEPRDTSENKRNKKKHRAPRITVPGEVLAPYELDYESWGSESDSDDSNIDGRVLSDIPERSLAAGSNKIKIKISKKEKKDKTEKPDKPPRGPRPPGTMGTNVHSSVAGISTSNALAKLKPPPPDAKNGDEHLPWLALNDYELAKLRKRMKKNAIWSPSDTMIARELASLGRGYENFLIAKAEADVAGEVLEIPPQLRGETVHTEGAISVDAVRSKDTKLSNRGMKLNEAKKAKRENAAKQAANEAALEAEAAAQKMTSLKSNMANMFAEQDKDKKPVAKAPAKTAANKKRKRESPAPDESQKLATGTIAGAAPVVKPPLKRTKTETPVPVPQTIFAKQVSPINPPESVLSAASPAPILTPVVETALEILAPPILSPKKASTPILPPTKDSKKTVKKEVVKKEVKKPESAPTPSTRSRRNEEVIAPAPVTSPVVGPAPEPLPAKRPTSSRSKKASEEPMPPQAPATTDRPRRSSTARNTPAPPEPHKMNRRAKRPIPGVLSASSDGSAAVSVAKRSKATRKKAGAKKDKKDAVEGNPEQEYFEEYDDEGNLIPADEPRYCYCNRVQFGVMVGCDNHDCDIEWFHLECVGLPQAPPTRAKWYCPECRVALNLGPKGEANARGKKK